MKIFQIILFIFTLNMFSFFPIDNNKENFYINDDIIDEIVQSIKNGDAAWLSSFFSSTIILTVPDNEGTYSKTQSELIMKNFFTKNPPRNFSIKQKGFSGEGSQFAIGNYVSTTGKLYRTYFLLTRTNNKYFITLLEFEAES